MKKILLLVCLISLAGCAPRQTVEPNTPNYLPAVKPTPAIGKLHGWDGPTAMDDIEVLEASKRCMYASLIPNVEYTAVRIDTGGKVLVPIAVHCEHK